MPKRYIIHTSGADDRLLDNLECDEAEQIRDIVADLDQKIQAIERQRDAFELRFAEAEAECRRMEKELDELKAKQ